MSKTRKKLMIIDGNALVHRSFHALPPTMKTKEGLPTNAVYGFASFLIKSIRDLKPEYVVLTMDKKGKTFRHEKFKEYKAKRVKAPDELYAQMPMVKELATAFNIPIFEKSGFEADDLIGTISKNVSKEVDCIIVTGDMDTLQLVDNHTKVYTMSRGLSESVLYDADMVNTRYKITPEQIIDYKALRGDPSDNIPGVPGVGEKTAVNLLSEFKTLENLYKVIEKDESKLEKVVKPRIINLLKEHKDSAYMSQYLATIKRDVEIQFDLEKTLFKDMDKETVVNQFNDFEFKSLLPRVQMLFNDHVNETKEEKAITVGDKFERNRTQFNYTLIDNDKSFKKFITKLKKHKGFTFDTETTGIDPLTCDLLGISLAWGKGEAYYINFKGYKKDSANQEQGDLFGYQGKEVEKESLVVDKSIWLDELKNIFENEKVKKYAHNAKFDTRVLRHQGIDVKGLDFDTMIASYLLNPGSRQHGLDASVFSELNFEKINKTDLLGKGRDKLTYSTVDTEKLSLYSCEDADFTNRLVDLLKKRIKEQKIEKLFNEIEMPLVEVLAEMEDVGVKINRNFLLKMSKEMTSKLIDLEKKIFKHAGGEFNVRSTQQLKEVLFEKLEIPSDGIKKTKTGISTAADELDKLLDKHPIIKLIQEHRELSKLISTYVDTLPKLINKITGRVHTSFNQTVTATGRLSSSDPNLQNIPIRTETGRKIREAFVAENGYKLIALDYSQIELRLAAHYSGDKKMINAFNNNVDIHSSTAAEINQVSSEEVDKTMRREAKAINFGILYGQGPHGLSRSAEIPYMRAKEFIESYFIAYKDVKKFIDETVEFVREKGYVETLFKRKRYLPEINSTVPMVKKAAERMAVNTPLQGTAADMIKVAMIKLHEILPKDVKMIIQVHDELVFEVKEKDVTKWAKQIKDVMENVLKLKVPVVVDVQVGDNWGKMKELEL